MAEYRITCQLKPYIQPFEEVLALKELERISGKTPIVDNPTNGDYVINSHLSSAHLASRLTYWQAITESSKTLVTQQVKREATTGLIKNNISIKELSTLLPFKNDIPKVNRRNLRYGPHGIHEYRGKFFPQLVRSLLNIAGADPTSLVLDPMCGSGTTAVEASLMGCSSIGIDLNPLSVLMSKVKCDVLGLRPEVFANEYINLKNDLSKKSISANTKLVWLSTLSLNDQEYLKNWFSLNILRQLDVITIRINQTSDETCRGLFQIVLSNILRKVSWQKVDDLRVRKEVKSETSINVWEEFSCELDRSFKSIYAFLIENEGIKMGRARIIEGDSRNANRLLKNLNGKIDVVVTSPPYATALPYLDTDRLSLYYFNLLNRKEHRARDYEMIGNREVTNGLKNQYWDSYLKNRDSLPNEIRAVIEEIDLLNRDANVGFRRKNLSALLCKYFMDMRLTLQSFQKLLKSQGHAFVVIGNNHTTAGNKSIEIETDTLLGILGESVGLILEGKISMDMLTSRDIFKKNAGSAETILFFRKG